MCRNVFICRALSRTWRVSGRNLGLPPNAVHHLHLKVLKGLYLPVALPHMARLRQEVWLGPSIVASLNHFTLGQRSLDLAAMAPCLRPGIGITVGGSRIKG